MSYYFPSQSCGTRTMGKSFYFRELQGKKQCPQGTVTFLLQQEKRRDREYRECLSGWTVNSRG